MKDSNEARYTIVVGVDFEQDGIGAVDTALELAEARGGNAEVHLVNVEVDLMPHVAGLEAGVGAFDRDVDKRTKAGLDALEQLATDRAIAYEQRGSPLATESLTAHYRIGQAAQQIVRLAADVDADLIVVGTHGRTGMKRVLLGSVAASVLKLAHCPVFVVRPKDHEGVGELPEIEAACPACVATRKATDGKEWWCQAHSTARRPLAHRYHYSESITRSSPAPWGPSMG